MVVPNSASLLMYCINSSNHYLAMQLLILADTHFPASNITIFYKGKEQCYTECFDKW